MIYFRLLLILLWVLGVSIAGIPICFVRWGDLDLDRFFATLISRGVRAITGIQAELEGQEHLEASQPCIYVANHQSAMDVVSFGAFFPHRTIGIGKKEVWFIPFFNILFAASGNIMIDRKNRTRAVAGLAKAVSRLHKDRASIFIFPEGTRNRTGEGLLPFKKGAFHMAIQAGVPVVPLLSSPVAPLVDWKSRRLKAGTLRLRVLPPVSTQGLTTADIDSLSDRVRGMMLEALRGLPTIVRD